ncbi:DUF3299 domain-containing protein [Brevundimonas sp. SL130]|uniref:DUF3299 domain-containing protein n=1 Tax=Brevundimonas sp. SL130 TaxID=2995143 RepID=UPI00226CAC5B|nr:DUF3299 domain-containing protein [Brevundimonas sp. SL130]WAC59053.1 DUF3299 domain-containing protein [Brevundimonas sp. SL130]
MRISPFALSLAVCGLSACDRPTPPDAAAPPAVVTAAESAAINAAAGNPGRAGQEPDVGSISASGQTDAGSDEDAEWAALEAEISALPPIRTGPMASVGAGAGGPPVDGELASERRTQLDLPRADGPLWRKLRQTRISIDDRTQLYRAAHPASVRAIAGQTVTVRGYMLPLESTDRTAHFLISPYTPVCFFHPPAEPNEIIEVRLSRPIEAGYHLVEVTGTLELADNGEKGLFFVINDGRGRIAERVD